MFSSKTQFVVAGSEAETVEYKGTVKENCSFCGSQKAEKEGTLPGCGTNYVASLKRNMNLCYL